MADDPVILSFDTATPCCSVALTRGDLRSGVCLAEVSFNAGVTHSRKLLGSIDWLLDQVSMSIADVQAVAVGLGPGSFTGLRIGMATAKGLIFGTDVPLIGLPSLDTIGMRIPTKRLVCATLDARKKELYYALYKPSSDGEMQRISEPAVQSAESLAQNITEPVIMAGDGSRAYHQELAALIGPDVTFMTTEYDYPSAKIGGFLAYDYLQKQDFMDLDSAAPLYVRASDAELSLVRKTA
ncbi:MAG: tRNA (adenosine(37)-N6)-threonylcarbamoyltransferase complex dimerization subunit type 1 TsaB [Desulfobulbaceae bacterium]|nr:MAG: tRNA (adenosine(37)-N6)-threonylcarbamoyltransferase complex dimerization subunit type 1 TsaB [Desulfobulbaceae bacterium]